MVGETGEMKGLRGSRRIANMPPEMQGTSLTLMQAKCLVCRRLGVEFEEPAVDPADLLAHFASCFQNPLSVPPDWSADRVGAARL